MKAALEIGFELDQLYRLVQGGAGANRTMDQSKKPELLLLCEQRQTYKIHIFVILNEVKDPPSKVMIAHGAFG